MSDSKEPARAAMSRRAFAQHAALAAGAAALAPAALLASTQAPAPPDNQSASAPSPETAPLPPELQAEADARIDAILRRQGHRLTAEQKAEIRRLVVQGMRPLEAFRAFPLDNADEPATVLHAARKA